MNERRRSDDGMWIHTEDDRVSRLVREASDVAGTPFGFLIRSPELRATEP